MSWKTNSQDMPLKSISISVSSVDATATGSAMYVVAVLSIPAMASNAARRLSIDSPMASLGPREV
jgi:hypothetical protein